MLGASGYTGEEVIRLMALHPTFAATVLTGESQAGKVRNGITDASMLGGNYACSCKKLDQHVKVQI